jgi:peptidoglycan hydrolase-like protein with peptidoglycan-binding domain
MATGFYLLDRKVSGPRKWYAADEDKRVCVQHVTAGLEGRNLTDDQSAEATAQYAATTNRAVSWHDGVDTDSVVRLLPAGYTAFHAATANRDGIGQEISKKTTSWRSMPEAWVTATLRNSAEAWRPHVRRYGIPLRLLTAAERRRGLKGFIAHATVDPSRRSDPGGDFPWDRLFELIDHPIVVVSSLSAGRGVLRYGSRGYWVEVLQRFLHLPDDGVFGRQTQAAVIAWQQRHGLAPDGEVGAAMWARIDEETSGTLRPEEDDDMPSSQEVADAVWNARRAHGPARGDGQPNENVPGDVLWALLGAVNDLRAQVERLEQRLSSQGPA